MRRLVCRQRVMHLDARDAHLLSVRVGLRVRVKVRVGVRVRVWVRVRVRVRARLSILAPGVQACVYAACTQRARSAHVRVGAVRTGSCGLTGAYRELEPKLHEGEAYCEPAGGGAGDEVCQIHEGARAHEDAVEQQRAPVVNRHACQQGLVSTGTRGAPRHACPVLLQRRAPRVVRRRTSPRATGRPGSTRGAAPPRDYRPTGSAPPGRSGSPPS